MTARTTSKPNLRHTAKAGLSLAIGLVVGAAAGASSFSDGGPEMVALEAGEFSMGSPGSERDRLSNEGPVRTIAVGPFALSQHEITVGEFRRFIEASGYQTDAEIQGESTVYNVLSGSLVQKSGVNWRHDFVGKPATDALPVVHVSWNDAKAYVAWLASETGQAYRLPSEAEFEYALRGGTKSPYWWGASAPRRKVENLTGQQDKIANRWQWPDAFARYGDGHWGPAPHGSFRENPFGLYDIGGNVMEWVADCYGQLDALPGDATALEQEDCSKRVLRGGSWASPPKRARSASRVSAAPSKVSSMIGFRVARDL